MRDQRLLTVISLADEHVGMHTIADLLLSRVQELDLAGATVLQESNPTESRGLLTRFVHPHHPTIIEIVDDADKLEAARGELLADLPASVIVLCERVQAQRGAGE